MSVSIVQLQVFVTAADTGGFAAAADELGVTQSAISHAIAELERALDAVLIVRRPVFSLTAIGTAALPYARSTLASRDAFIASIAQTRNDLSGTVRLGATSTVCFGLLPTLLANWKAAFPSIDISVFEGDDAELVTWLDNGTVDASILINPQRIHQDGVVVGRDQYCAVVREDHPFAAEPSVTARDLLDDPVLVSGGGCGPEIMAMFRALDSHFQPVQRVYDNAALLNFVAADLGITVFPSIGRGLLPSGTVMVPLSPVRAREMVFSGPSNRPWHPLVEALCGQLRSNLGR